MIGNHYVLITKGACPACQEAIELLKSKGLKFIFTDMEYAPDVLGVTKLATGHPTVPMIWEVSVEGNIQKPAANKFIGGFDDLQRYLSEDDEVSE